MWQFGRLKIHLGILIVLPSFLMVLPLLVYGESPHGGESWPVVTMLADRDHEVMAQRLSEAVEAQLSDLRVSFVVRWGGGDTSRLIVERFGAESPEALAMFWVSLEEERLFLGLTTEEGQMVLSRTLEGSGSGAYAEIVANILRASIQVLLDETDGSEVLLESETWELEDPHEVGEPLSPVEPPSPMESSEAVAEAQPHREESPEPPREAERLSIEAGYHLGIWSRTHPTVHGIALSAGLRLYRSLYVSITYRVTFPLEMNDDDVYFKLHPHPLSFALWYGWESSRVSIAGGAAVTVMVLSQETRVQAPMVATEESARVVTSLEPLLRLGVRLYGPLSFVSMIGVSILFRPLDYVVDRAHARQTLVEMWRAQPYVLVGLSVGLL